MDKRKIITLVAVSVIACAVALTALLRDRTPYGDEPSYVGARDWLAEYADPAILGTGKDKPELKDTNHTMLVKYTMVDKSALEGAPAGGDGSLINWVYADQARAGRAVMGQWDGITTLHDAGGDMLVAVVDATAQNGAGHVVDADFARLGTDADMIEGAVADLDHGLGYIPASWYLDDKGDEVTASAVCQLLVAFDPDEDPTCPVDVTLESERIGTPVLKAHESVEGLIYDSLLEIPVTDAAHAKDIGMQDIQVTLDGFDRPILLTDKNSAWDDETGTLCLGISAMTVNTVHVKVLGSPAALAEAAARVVLPGKAYALAPQYVGVTAPAMSFYPYGAYDRLDLDAVKRAIDNHTVWTYNSNTYYRKRDTFDDLAYGTGLYNAVGPSAYIARGAGTSWSETVGTDHGGISSGTMGRFLMDGEEWKKFANSLYAAEPQYDGTLSDLLLAFDLPGCNYWRDPTNRAPGGLDWHGLQSYKYKSGNATHETQALVAPATCAHISNTQNYDSEAMEAPVWARPLYLNTTASQPYLIMGFVTPQINTQSGVVIYKFRVTIEGKLGIEKSSASSSVTDGSPCYSLEGAKYTVYKDRDCTQSTGKTLTTDASGKTSQVGLDDGTYYVKETAAPEGYLLDDKPHEVKIERGDEITLKLTDEPITDPAAAIVQKLDKDGSR